MDCLTSVMIFCIGQNQKHVFQVTLAVSRDSARASPGPGPRASSGRTFPVPVQQPSAGIAVAVPEPPVVGERPLGLGRESSMEGTTTRSQSTARPVIPFVRSAAWSV